MVAGSRLRQIGWVVALTICLTLFIALTFKVNAVKAEVRLAERSIVSLERKRLLLETEFQTRASQQQLADWNAVEFGYAPPGANQYLENERQLAALGLPRSVGAPEPIRVARTADPDEAPRAFRAMVSPLTGAPVRAPTPVESGPDLAERLALDDLLDASIEGTLP